MPPPVQPAGSKLLVEFRAGRILKEGTTAKPDTRKGLVRVLRVSRLAEFHVDVAARDACACMSTDLGPGELLQLSAESSCPACPSVQGVYVPEITRAIPAKS
jgi:hypothetical protein